jgi:hypothetical protein
MKNIPLTIALFDLTNKENPMDIHVVKYESMR